MTAGAAASETDLRPSLSAHFHASQLRSDSWGELKRAAARLAQLDGGSDAEALRATVARALDVLEPIEQYWAFPGPDAFAHLRESFERGRASDVALLSARITRALSAQTYRRHEIPLLPGEEWEEGAEERELSDAASLRPGEAMRPYFEVLVVDDIGRTEERVLRDGLRSMRRPEDRFVYELVVVRSFEDAVIAGLFNFNVQAVVVRYGLPMRSGMRLEVLSRYLSGIDADALERMTPGERGRELGVALHRLRPELDLYLVTDAAVEQMAGAASEHFRRIFYRQEDYLELHMSILRGVGERYRAPFFKALREYAEQPTGVFHALPISRGKSVVRSNWIRDMVGFYGLNIFLAETSSTSGGLDSLLEPRSSLKEAQEAAARAFGARRTFFVTNGTSTANKIVVQSLVKPGDIVLVDRNCHKSHHYTLVLSGAQVVYLDSYPLHEFSFYGAVPLASIERTLRGLEADGKLDRVKLLLLTNCTFDGIVYDPERVMHACLSIKPDLAFVWDEAWFAFARFSPMYRRRTAMEAAGRLREQYRSEAYAEQAAADPSLPDPARVRLRVYATQSTHKTLTSLRQGSMIHVFDQDWGAVEHAFRDAFMTHTSTSPNYQILASLDLGRRQGELEGYELVQKQVDLALILRETVAGNPRLRRWFRFLTTDDMIPDAYRPSGMKAYYDPDRGWAPMEASWSGDEFVLDPSRLTLYVGATGIDGDTFKREHLMARHGIQVNKTSRNTVLFMTNIGTTRSSIAHLIEVLAQMAARFEEELEDVGPAERRLRAAAVHSLTEELPPLPDFSRFHDAFRPDPGGATPEGDLRKAYFLSADEEACEYVPIASIPDDRELVSARFVTPYPPGFPILVPGQVVSSEILAYLRALDVKEIHGFRSEFGLRVFTEAALDAASGDRR